MHKMALIVDMKMYTYDQTRIPLTPYSWYRACMAVDTIGGVITVVVNGNKEVDQVVKEFENSFQKRPKSMKDKLLLFKMWPMGFWYQSRGRVANVNIFAAKLSPEKMIRSYVCRCKTFQKVMIWKV